MYPLPALISDAFAGSDALVVEANILNSGLANAASLVAEQGFYKDGSTLQSNIAEDTWQALNKALAKYSFPVAFFQRQKPWLVALTMTTLELKQLGYSEDLGIDYHFLKQANSQKMRIIELESIIQQLGFFTQLSSTEQEAFLRATLKELDKGTDYLDALLNAWQAGDAERIDQLINESFKAAEAIPGAERIYHLLISDRNHAMTQKIEDLLQQKKTYFIIIGAGHMVSEQGIVRLLKGKGYAVERL